MKIINLKIKGSWRDVADSARTTINREPGTKEPTSAWKRKMLLAEHSPIRQMFISAKWGDLPYWVSVHIVRHKIGIEHWVRTQRSDRTGTDRGQNLQSAEVEHEILASYQAMITISRKRLCHQASPETREAWTLLTEEVKKADPELYQACVPDCVYRGWCMEYKSCGYHKTEAFRKALAAYREGINTVE
ncbi:MAG: thymidylate synthase ThyX [Spirochaetales bacterium]|nr:thymidylate synthase ThyX [Spirochaetales bacterium]